MGHFMLSALTLSDPGFVPIINSCTHNQIVYVLGAQNVKDHVSSIKSLDLVAIQSSASILRKSENLKIPKSPPV